MKAIYFEYPSEDNEFFEKLADKLYEINITDNKKYWCRPFQDTTYIKDNNKKMTKLKICLSPNISEYVITDEKEKEKIDLQIEEMWQELLNEDEIIEEDNKIEKLTPFEAPFLKDGKPDIRFRLILDKINEIIDYLNKEGNNNE